VAGLETLCQRMGCYSPCRGMYLELRPRPVSREHARPQPPAGRRRYGGGAEEPAPVPVGVTGHRTQRPRGQVGPPGPHPAQPSSSLDPGGERRPIPPPLAPLIAQLVPYACCLRCIWLHTDDRRRTDGRPAGCWLLDCWGLLRSGAWPAPAPCFFWLFFWLWLL
jgi:hypothetical protein